MSEQIKKRRRQAASLCFEKYLTKEQLTQAIELLERDFQVEGSINLIAYVAKVCMQFGINLQEHKNLHSQLISLINSDAPLSIKDPLALLKQTTPTDLILSTDTTVNEPSTSIAAHTLVFAHLMHHVIKYSDVKAALFSTLIDLVSDKKSKDYTLYLYVHEWVKHPNSFRWSESLDVAKLTQLVHLVYTALCELLGPIATDDCFHRALTVCEHRPEARQFPPAKFL